MTNWIRLQAPSSSCSNELGTLQLAWLGDAVWEMHQRLKHCQRPAKSNQLHLSVVKEVRASSQAKALAYLEPLLSEIEIDLVRRARNKAGRGPRNGDPVIYGKATGFETIVGWLFLHNPERLAELLDQLDKIDFNQSQGLLK